MDYIEVRFNILSGDSALAKEILIAQLGEYDFESFSEENNCLSAFIKEDFYSREIVDSLPVLKGDLFNIEIEENKIIAQNWNEEWESSFKPIVIDEKCIIKATFHKDLPKYEYEIIIEPKMSFGTGHHETTTLLAKEILKRNFSGQNVLDMGCGTGILAILAAKRGAKYLTAIDIDEWAYENSIENVRRNEVSNINVFKGGAELLGSEVFDSIFANINLNILLADMSQYSRVLNKGGEILFSGIFETDLDSLKNRAFKCNLEYLGHECMNNWIVASFRKI